MFLVIVLIIACAPNEPSIPIQAEDFCENTHRNDSISMSKEAADISELIEEKTGVFDLEDGAGSMISRAWFTEYS